jgi:hypothetical protein
MGITISGPSTQIPTNVVEVGNEITQNQLNAITASNVPSTGNPLQTLSAVQTYVGNFVLPTVNQKINSPLSSWTHPFPAVGNFVCVLRPDTNLWWPWNTNGTQIHSVSGGTFQASYNFDFTDNNGSQIYLNGNPDVGTSNTVYTTLGQWDSVNQTTYSTTTSNSYYPANGPSNGGDWSGYVGNSGQFWDGSYYQYRYAYHNGSGGFYTADNMNNPPY